MAQLKPTDDLILRFTNIFLNASKELQKVAIWLDEEKDRNGKTKWQNLFEKALKELQVIYGYFVEFEPNDEEVIYFIEPKNDSEKQNISNFNPPYIPYFPNEKTPIIGKNEELYDLLRRSKRKFESVLKSPKIYQHLPIQFNDKYELISDKYLNCYIPCEIKNKNDYYVILFEEVAFFQFAYCYITNDHIYKYYPKRKRLFLTYLLKFALSIENKLGYKELHTELMDASKKNSDSTLRITNSDRFLWNKPNENRLRNKIHTLVYSKNNNANLYERTDSIIKNIIDKLLEKYQPVDENKFNTTKKKNRKEMLKHIARFDVEASFAIKNNKDNLILHDVFVFPLYTETEPIFKTHCIHGIELDIYSPVLLVLYIKTLYEIQKEFDETKESVDGFQLTKEIAKLFAEKIIQKDYLKNVIRKQTKYQAIKAAISQVMARNMSHNIGSHVLNNLTDGLTLSRIDKFECHSYIPSDELRELNNESKIIHQLAIYNNYVKCRMDYLSDVTFGTPVMHTNKKVYGELYKDFDKVRLLLEHISGLSESFKFQIRFAINDNEINNKNDFSIALPNDLLGCQAFYNIIENVIRNTAKHNQNKTKETTFTVNFKDISETIKDIAERDLFYEVEIYDSIPVKNIDTLVRAQNDKINLSILQENNQLRNSSLGLLEMEASAAYLRKIDITKIEDNNYKIQYSDNIHYSHNKLNVLQAFSKKKSLGYRFFVSKPTEFLIVGDFNLSDFQKQVIAKKGVWIRNMKELQKELKKDIVFNHQFLLFKQTALIIEIINNYKTNLPLRILEINNENALLGLLKSDFSFSKVEQWVWEQWFVKIKGPYETINVFTIYSSKNKNHNQTNRYNIAFSHHNETVIDCKNDVKLGNINSFDVLATVAKNKLPGMTEAKLNMSEYIEYVKSNFMQKIKLFDASIKRIVILDERIQKFSRDKYLELSNLQIYNFINIHLPINIELDKENYSRKQITQIEKYIINELALDNNAFLVIHYGILERMYGSNHRLINENLQKWSEQLKEKIIITSGRGKPPELPSRIVCFMNLSPILNVFTQVRSKYAINYLLSTARK